MLAGLSEFVCGRWLQSSCLACDALGGTGQRCAKALPQVLKEAGLLSARDITAALRPLGLPNADRLQVNRVSCERQRVCSGIVCVNAKQSVQARIHTKRGLVPRSSETQRELQARAGHVLRPAAQWSSAATAGAPDDRGVDAGAACGFTATATVARNPSAAPATPTSTAG